MERCIEKKYKNNFNNKNFVRKNSKNDKKIFEKNQKKFASFY